MEGTGGGGTPHPASTCLFLASMILGSVSVHIVDPGIQSENGDKIVGISGNEPAFSGVNVNDKLKPESNANIGLQPGNALPESQKGRTDIQQGHALPESQKGRQDIGADIAVAGYSADSLNIKGRNPRVTKEQAPSTGPKNDPIQELKISNQELTQIDGVQSQVASDNQVASHVKRFAKGSNGASPPSNTHEHHLGNRNDIRPNDAPPTNNRLSVGNNDIRQRLPENIQLSSDRQTFSFDGNGNGMSRNFDQHTPWSANDRQQTGQNREDLRSNSRVSKEGTRRNDVRTDQRNGNDFRSNNWSENGARHQNQGPFQNQHGNDFRSNARSTNTANDFRGHSFPESRTFRQENQNGNDFQSTSWSRNDLSQRSPALNENRNGNDFRRNFQNDARPVNRNENDFRSAQRSAHDAPSDIRNQPVNRNGNDFRSVQRSAPGDARNRNTHQQDPWESPNNNNGNARNGFSQDENGRVRTGIRSGPSLTATSDVGRHPSEIRRHDPAGRRWDEPRAGNTGSGGNNGWMNMRANDFNRNINAKSRGGRNSSRNMDFQEFNDRTSNNGDIAPVNSPNNGPINNGNRNDRQRASNDGFHNIQNDNRWDSGVMNGSPSEINMQHGLNSIHDARNPNQDPFMEGNSFRNSNFEHHWVKNDPSNDRTAGPSNTMNANGRTHGDNMLNDQRTGWIDHSTMQSIGRDFSFHDPSTNAGSRGHFRRNDVNEISRLSQNRNGDRFGMDNMNVIRSPHERSWNRDNSPHNILGGSDNRFMPVDENRGWWRNGDAGDRWNRNTGPFQNFRHNGPALNEHRGSHQQPTIVVHMLPKKPPTPAPPIGLDLNTLLLPAPPIGLDLNTLLLRMALEDVLPDIDFPPRVRSVTQPEPVSTVDGVAEAPIQTTPVVTQASAQSMLSVPEQPLPKKTVPESTLTKVTVLEIPVKRAIPYELKQSSIPQRKNRKFNEMMTDAIEKINIAPLLKTDAMRYTIAENKLPTQANVINLQVTASKPVRRTRQRVTEYATTSIPLIPSIEGTTGTLSSSLSHVNTKIETAIVLEPLGTSEPAAKAAIPIAIEPIAVAAPTTENERPVIVEPLSQKTLHVNEVVVDAVAIGASSKIVIDSVAKEFVPVTVPPSPIASISVAEPIPAKEMPTVFGLAKGGGNPTIDIPISPEPVAEIIVKPEDVVYTQLVGAPSIVVLDLIANESLPITSLPITVESATGTPAKTSHVVLIPLPKPTAALEMPIVIEVVEGGNPNKDIDIHISIEPVSATIVQPVKVTAAPVLIEYVAAVKTTKANENPIIVDHLSIIKGVGISDNQLTITPEVATTSTPLATITNHIYIADPSTSTASTADTRTVDTSYVTSNLSQSEIAIDSQLKETIFFTSANETIPSTNILSTDYIVVTTISPPLQTTPSEILSNLTVMTSANISVDITLSGNGIDINLVGGDISTSTISPSNVSSLVLDLGMITVIDNSTGNDTTIADEVTNTNASLAVDDSINTLYATFPDNTFSNDTTFNVTNDFETDQRLSLTTNSQGNSVKIAGASLYESVTVLKPDPSEIGSVHKSKSNVVIPTTPKKQSLSFDLQKLQENKIKSVRNSIQKLIRSRLANTMQSGTAPFNLAIKVQNAGLNTAASYGNGKAQTKKLTGSQLDYPKTKQSRFTSGQKVTTKLIKSPVKIDRPIVLSRQMSTQMANFLKHSNFVSTPHKTVRNKIFHGFYNKNGNVIPLATFTPKTKKPDIGLGRQPFVDMPHIPTRATDKSQILDVLNRAHGKQTIAATQSQDYGMNADHYNFMNMMHMHQLSKLMAADRPEAPEYEPIEPIEISLPEVFRPPLPPTTKENNPVPEQSTVNSKATTLNNISSRYKLKAIPQQHHIVRVSVSQYPDATGNAQRAPKIDKKTVIVNARNPPTGTLNTANTLRVNKKPAKLDTQRVGTQRVAITSRARLSGQANQLYPAVKGHPRSGSNAAPIVINNTGSVPSWPSEYIVLSDRTAGSNGPTMQVATGTRNSGPMATGITGAVKATPNINTIASTNTGNQVPKTRTTSQASRGQTVTGVSAMGLNGPNNRIISARTSALTKQSTGKSNTETSRKSKTTTGSLTVQQPRIKSMANGQIASKSARNGQIASKSARNMGIKTAKTGSSIHGKTRAGATRILAQDIVGKRITGTKQVGKTVIGSSRQKTLGNTGTKTAGPVFHKNVNLLKGAHATYGNKAKSTTVSSGVTIGGLQGRNKDGLELAGSFKQGKVRGAALSATKNNAAVTIGHSIVDTAGARARSNTASQMYDTTGAHASGRIGYGTAGDGGYGHRGNIGSGASHSATGVTGNIGTGEHVAGSYAVHGNTATAGAHGAIISHINTGTPGYNGNIESVDPGYAIYGNGASTGTRVSIGNGASTGAHVSIGNGAAVHTTSGVNVGQGRSKSRPREYANHGNTAATGTATNGAGYYPSHSSTGATGRYGTAGYDAGVYGTVANAGASRANGVSARAMGSPAYGLAGGTYGNTGRGARRSKAQGSPSVTKTHGTSETMATGLHAQGQAGPRTYGRSGYAATGFGTTGASGKTGIKSVGQGNTGIGTTVGHATVKTGSITHGVHGNIGVNIDANSKRGRITQAAYGNTHVGAPVAKVNVNAKNQIQTGASAAGIGAHGGLGPRATSHIPQINAGVGAAGSGAYGAPGASLTGTIPHGNTGANGGLILGAMHGSPGSDITGNYGNIGTGNARNAVHGGSTASVTHGNAGAHAVGSVHQGVAGMGVAGTGSQIQTGTGAAGIGVHGGFGPRTTSHVSQSNAGVGASGYGDYGAPGASLAGTIPHVKTRAYGGPILGAMHSRLGVAITGNYGNIGTGNARNAAQGLSTASVSHGNAGAQAAGSVHHGVAGIGVAGNKIQIQTGASAAGIGVHNGFGPRTISHVSQSNAGVGASGYGDYGASGASLAGTIPHGNTGANGGPILGVMHGNPGGSIAENNGNIGIGNARNAANGGSTGSVTHGYAGSHAAGTVHHGAAGMAAAGTRSQLQSGGSANHHGAAGMAAAGTRSQLQSGASANHGGLGAQGTNHVLHGSGAYGVSSANPTGVNSRSNTGAHGGATHGNHPGVKTTGSLVHGTFGSNVMGASVHGTAGATLAGHSSPVSGTLGSRSYGSGVTGSVVSPTHAGAATAAAGNLAYNVGQANPTVLDNTGSVAIGNTGAVGYPHYGTADTANSVGSTYHNIYNNAGSTGAGWAAEYGTGRQGNAAASASVHAIGTVGGAHGNGVAGGTAGSAGLGPTDTGAVWGAQYGHGVVGRKPATGQPAIGTGNAQSGVPINKLPGMTKATRPAQSNRNVGGMVPLITPVRSKLGGVQQNVASSGNQGVGGPQASSVNNVGAVMEILPHAQGNAFGSSTQHGQQTANTAQHSHAVISVKQIPGQVGPASGTHVAITIHAGTGADGHPRPLRISTNLNAAQNVRPHRLTGSPRSMQTGTLHSRGGSQRFQGHGSRTGATWLQTGDHTPTRQRSRTRGRPVSKSRISSVHVNPGTLSRSHPRVEPILLSHPKLLVLGPTLLKPVHTVHKVRTVHKVLAPSHSLNRITGIRYKKPGVIRAHSILPIKVVPILSGKVLPKLKRKRLYPGVGATLHMKSSRYPLFSLV